MSRRELLSQGHLVFAVLGIATLTACAAGPEFTADNPAGFWAGLWHGVISLVTLIISIFSDQFAFYEVDNKGWTYDVGFWIGVVLMAGSGSSTVHNRRRRKQHDAEWAEINRKVEAKLRRMIRDWADAEPDDDWKVVGDKAEARLKREIRTWADEP